MLQCGEKQTERIELICINTLNLMLNMKRLILLFLLFSACHIMAQRRFNGVNNLYYRDTTFYENGYAYQCDVQEGSMFITLYNKENKYTYVDQTFKGTNRPVSIKDTERGGPHLEPDNWTKKKTYSIINNAFSAAEKKECQEKDL